jgi:hypothetical protein
MFSCHLDQVGAQPSTSSRDPDTSVARYIAALAIELVQESGCQGSQLARIPILLVGQEIKVCQSALGYL